MLRAALPTLLLAVACATSAAGQPAGAPEHPTERPCRVAGCSAQVCTDRDDVVTTCEWREEYGCYRAARCERQPDGACAWTPTPELAACVDAARARR